MKNTGKSGNLATTSIEIKDFYDIDSLLYVYTKSSQIDKVYEKLRLIYDRSLHKDSLNYREWAKKHKVSLRLMPEMKRLGYCNSSSEWQLSNPPRKGDAVVLQLAIRKSEQEAKRKVADRKHKHHIKTGGNI